MLLAVLVGALEREGGLNLATRLHAGFSDGAYDAVFEATTFYLCVLGSPHAGVLAVDLLSPVSKPADESILALRVPRVVPRLRQVDQRCAALQLSPVFLE